tara:strand:- start:4078 stop:4296 length:219 start_codon:yes stop_codon:yes gene_type:complete
MACIKITDGLTPEQLGAIDAGTHYSCQFCTHGMYTGDIDDENGCCFVKCLISGVISHIAYCSMFELDDKFKR